MLAQEKQSSTVVLQISVEDGIKCIDTSSTPPRVSLVLFSRSIFSSQACHLLQTILSNSVYEIAHCGVDVSKAKVFTCIVGTKGAAALFFCHVFKCETKEQVLLQSML